MTTSFHMKDCNEKDLDYTYGIDYAAKLGLPQSVIDVAKLFREKHSNSAFSYEINVVDKNKEDIIDDQRASDENDETNHHQRKTKAFKKFSSYIENVLRRTDEGNPFKTSIVNKSEICEKLQAMKLHITRG